MDYSTAFGILLIASGGISLACGTYATNGILNTRVKKLLAVICFALLAWSLGLAISAVASNETISEFGHLFAPIGWGPMSGLLLHFTLLITEKDKLLRKWWIYPILYLPGLALVLGFTFLPAFGFFTDSFVHTSYGWVPVLNQDFFDYLYYAYFGGYIVINLIILLLDRKNSQDKRRKIQATLLAICYIIAYMLGTVSDIVFGYFDILIPRHASIYSLIPLGAMTYLIKNYGNINLDTNSQNNDEVHSNIYRIMSLGFLMGSVTNIISQRFVFNNSIPNVNEFSVVLLLVSAAIFIIDKLKIDFVRKELFVSIIYSFVMPYVTLTFQVHNSITVWAFVFLFYIICIIYNRKIILNTVIASSLMSQVLVLVISPSIIVEVPFFMLRFIYIGVAAALAAYCNYRYDLNLKKNASSDAKQSLLLDIMREFIATEDLSSDAIIHNFLEKCGNFFKSERAYIVLFGNATGRFENSYEWKAEGVLSRMESFENAYSKISDRLLKQFEKDTIAKLPDSNLLPPMAGELKKMLAEDNIRGLIAMPIKEKGEVIGVLGLNSSKPLKEWNIDSFDFVEIVANVVSDMILKNKAERKNEFFANYDLLTKLPNRALLQDRLELAMKLSNRTEKLVAVVLADVDLFKTINDTMGHDLGDELLVKVAQRLSNSIRDYDTVSRFGGDEFVIILNQFSHTKDIVRIMDKIMRDINKPFCFEDRELFITISAGIALYPQDGADAETLIKHADAAMYNAKKMGKNRYSFCSKDMKNEGLEKLELTNRLYRALEKDQLLVYYQPQIDIETKKIVGFEALLRWALPDRGMIGPATFIPIAEQTGLINPIGKWVLETACRQNKIWQDKWDKKFRIAINVSIYQLNDPDFIKQVKGVLKETGLEPECLEIEITESAASLNANFVVNILSRLKTMGINISIDDFGTEYSSLNRIKTLPVDTIKIDMQFVHGIDGNEKDKAITKVIINLAKSLNLNVIAEGVETNTQFDFLSQRMCDEVQGYYFSEPMPAEKIDEILQLKGEKWV